MSKTDTRAQSTATTRMRVDPSRAEGWSRILLFGGLGWLALGTMVNMAVIFWGGVGIVGLAFALNTIGKLIHYANLPIPRADQVRLAVSWVLLAVTVVGLLANYAYARYGVGAGEFFWALAVAGVGFGLLHMAAQSMYLPETEIEMEATSKQQ